MSKKKLAIFYFVLLILFSAGFFGFTSLSVAGEEDLIISEIMYDPAGADPKHEWLEIYNSSGNSINLDGWKFFEAGTNHGLTLFQGSFILNSKKYAIVADDAATFKGDYPDFSGTIIDSAFSLSNSGEDLAFKNKAGEIVLEFSYSSDSGGNGNGFSLEYANSGDWCESYVTGGTPGAKNSEKPAPKEYSQNIIFNELFPNPKNEDGEYIELYNAGDENADLSGWILRDASKSGKYVLPKDTSLETGEYLVIYKKDSKLSLNNSGEETVYLYNPNEELADKASYTGSKENKSYSFDGEAWRWSQYLTPGEDNLFNNLPIVSAKKENKVYVNTYAQFSAKGSDKDGEKLKFTWDFGDGHKSYLQNTRHKYEKTGEYTAVLKVSDGNEDVLENFQIKVVKFPKIKISLTEISANPKGADTKEGGEYILIKNESSKKINLKGWSIATGSKNLYNHPIGKDFILKPGQSKKLTRKYSKFALVNTKGKIEIRYPNGKAAYELKYAKDKIADDEIYIKINGQWQWIAPPAENKLALSENLVENNSVLVDNQEIQNNLGKYSENTEWQKKKENQIVLASYATHLSPPEDSGSQPRVLGASAIRDDSEYFSFGRPYAPEPHWAVKIWKDILIAINSFLNNLLLQF